MDENKLNFYINYQTKITNVYKVNLVGKLHLSLKDDEEGWYITEMHGVRRRLEEWLEKFDDRRVRILIEALGEDDDTELLKGEKL